MKKQTKRLEKYNIVDPL